MNHAHRQVFLILIAALAGAVPAGELPSSASVQAGTGAASPTPGAQTDDGFVEGEDYVVLEEAVSEPGNMDSIVVVEAFSYGCPYCFELETHLIDWTRDLGSDVEFRRFHAVWNEAMAFYAQIHYVIERLDDPEPVHAALFNAVQADQRALESPRALAGFLAEHGVNPQTFLRSFNSAQAAATVAEARERVRQYDLTGVPQFIVDGKYRVDPALAGGRREMLDVVDYLVDRERRKRTR